MKKYIKPEIITEIIIAGDIIAASTNIQIGSEIENGSTGISKARNNWGDLWNK